MAGGRPKKQIDWEKAVNLAKIQCTQVEICQVLGLSEDTLARALKRDFKLSFAEWYALHSAHGKASLRRWQFQSAQKGSVTMQMWLGKQWLNQSEEVKALEEEDETYERPASMRVSPEEVAAAKAELERRRQMLTKKADDAEEAAS